VFVSDIDLILQRGVADLLDRCKGADVVFNENTGNTNAGSRLTANLLLINPTDNAALFLRFLKAYLERALGGAEVSRWIDQFALLMARHHLSRRGKAPRIDYFDTASDINNVMYRSYQEHPFRFLSLYHGFDTSSLESNPQVLGRETAAPKKADGAPRKAAKPAGAFGHEDEGDAFLRLHWCYQPTLDRGCIIRRRRRNQSGLFGGVPKVRPKECTNRRQC
jgi:hypothetical protein